MARSPFYRERLDQHRDASGDLAPPWEKYPTYERYTIGWRMGSGEDWFSMWHEFLADLDPDRGSRAAYLHRHPPAPVPWADWVHQVLHPEQEWPDRDDLAELRPIMLRDGLIASDIAYPTWRSQQTAVEWPWESGRSPEDAARHWSRDFWFWSRRVAELRGEPGWKPPRVPQAWRSCEAALRAGNVGSPDPRRGLLTLAQVLCAGRVDPPWSLGLTPADFADTFDDDMGYADAFRLWCMCALDDRDQVDRLIPPASVPPGWAEWMADQVHVD